MTSLLLVQMDVFVSRRRRTHDEATTRWVVPVTVMSTALLVSPAAVSHQYAPLSVAGKAATMTQGDGQGQI